MSSVNIVMLSQTSHICCSHFYRYIHVSTSLYSIKKRKCIFFPPLFSIDTSKKWFPFRPNRTESCRTYTSSCARSKTKGRVCLPRCHEHLFPQRPQSSPLGGTGQPKASSAPGLTPTWITMESHTLVRGLGHLPLFLSLACRLSVMVFTFVLHVGMQQSSNFSGSEQSRLPHCCNTEQHTSLPLPAKEGTVGCEMVKSTFFFPDPKISDPVML